MKIHTLNYLVLAKKNVKINLEKFDELLPSFVSKVDLLPLVKDSYFKSH